LDKKPGRLGSYISGELDLADIDPNPCHFLSQGRAKHGTGVGGSVQLFSRGALIRSSQILRSYIKQRKAQCGNFLSLGLASKRTMEF
jgi:hypothetical protein